MVWLLTAFCIKIDSCCLKSIAKDWIKVTKQLWHFHKGAIITKKASFANINEKFALLLLHSGLFDPIKFYGRISLLFSVSSDISKNEIFQTKIVLSKFKNCVKKLEVGKMNGICAIQTGLKPSYRTCLCMPWPKQRLI